MLNRTLFVAVESSEEGKRNRNTEPKEENNNKRSKWNSGARVLSPQDEVHDKEDNEDSSSNKTGSQDRIRFPCFSAEGLVKSS